MQGNNVLVLPIPDVTKEPHYDLLGDRVCISVRIRKNGAKLDFWCHLKTPTQTAALEQIKARDIFFKPARGEEGTDIERIGSFEEDREFFDDHFITAFYKNEEVTREQIDQLDPVYRIKLATILFLFQTFIPPIDAATQTEPTLADLLANPIVTQAIMLADDKQTEHRLLLAHTFAPPSAADSLKYQGSQKLRTLEGGVQKLVLNHQTIISLYDRLIESPGGFYLGSEPCTLANKKEWVDRIPVVFKLHAVRELFRDADRKNV